MPPTKDQTAQILADAHFNLDREISRIFRIVAPNETANLTPIKLLEVNSSTTEVGIMPIAMTADPVRGIFFSSVIIEISPRELDRLQKGELSLPHGWQFGQELHRSPVASGAAG
jgi:hypothetical protein